MLKRNLIVFSILSVLMLLITACDTVTDEQLDSELQQLSDEELNALVEEGQVDEQKALAGQAVNRNRLVRVGRVQAPANRVQQQANIVISQRKPFTAITGLSSAQIKRSTPAQAWSSLKIPRGDFNVVVSEPLRVAAWQFQSELERQLGRSLVSEVRGLSSSYYQNDVLGNDLFYQYVENITDLSKLNALSNTYNKPAGWDASEKIAEQTMALSENQLVRLENAMVQSYNVVFRELERRNLAYLKPHFLRVMLQPTLLVVDATKYRGVNSALVQFLQQHETEIANVLTEKGLPNNALFVYDRIDGALVAVSNVDGKALANSFGMEAIGLGDCSLAYMVSSGKKKVGAPKGKAKVRDDAYVCPTMACGQLNVNAKDSLELKWGAAATEQNFEQMEQQNCKPSNEQRDASLQGINRGIATDSCVSGAAKSNDFQRSMLACAMGSKQDVGVGAETSLQPMRGMPNGDGCAISSGPKKTWVKVRTDKGYSYSTLVGQIRQTKEFGIGQDGKEHYQGGTTETVNPNTGETVSKAIHGTDGKVQRCTGASCEGKDNINVPQKTGSPESESNVNVQDQTGEKASNEANANNNNVKTDADANKEVNVANCIPEDGSCSDTCNPVGRETAKMAECSGMTANDLAAKMGRPGRQAADGQPPPGTTPGLILIKDGAGSKPLGQQNTCFGGLGATDQTCGVIQCSSNAAKNPGTCCGVNLENLKDSPPAQTCGAMVQQCNPDQVDPATGQCACPEFVGGGGQGGAPQGDPAGGRARR
ncbi:MAG: hypothetical protein Q8Q01_04320 [archaeon]|nr:hypothetical protein [archaeon]